MNPLQGQGGSQEQPRDDSMVPAQTPKKTPRKRRWITVGVVAALLIVSCVGYFRVAEAQATAVAQAFCSHLKTQDYTGAYQLFTAYTQRTLTQDTFLSVAQLADEKEGTVLSCSVQGVSQAAGGYAIDLQILRYQTFIPYIHRDYIISLGMKSEGLGWKIDDFGCLADVSGFADSSSVCPPLGVTLGSQV